IPPELEEVILRCLEKDPKARYTDARELELELRAILEHTGRGAAKDLAVRRRWNRRVAVELVLLVAATASLPALLPRAESIGADPGLVATAQRETVALWTAELGRSATSLWAGGVGAG